MTTTSESDDDRRPIAFLTARCMLAGGPEARDDAWEHDLEFGVLAPACAARGLTLSAVCWDDSELDPSAFRAFVIGTVWDYTDRPDEFLRALDRLAAGAPVFNPPDVVRWNLDKGYLDDLDRRGAPVVPTAWLDRADDASIAAAFDALRTDALVVKPRIGASAWRQARVSRGAPLPPAEALPPGRALAQPYLPAIETEGEFSFVFCGGRFSHAAQKLPAAGDYRVQSMYGARERAFEPAPGELAAARRALAAGGGDDLLYARVDMVRGPGGELRVMELELVEPYLYPDQGRPGPARPGLGAVFADALAAMVER